LYKKKFFYISEKEFEAFLWMQRKKNLNKKYFSHKRWLLKTNNKYY